MIVILLFMIAVFCMVFGHVCKVHRWGLLISVYEKPSESTLLNAMTTGHTLNALLPIRIGDIVRILWSGRKLKNGISLSAATVAVDLYIDVITVGLMFFGLAIIGKGGENLQRMAKVYMIIFIIIILFTIFAIMCRKLIKKIIKAIASIFNDKIEYRILYITYLCIASVKDIFLKIDKLKFIVLTFGIWTGYVVSYVVFAEAIQKYGIYYATSDVFTELFSGASIYHVPYAALPMWIAYLLLPLAVCAILSVMVHRKEQEVKVFKATLPQMNEKDKLAFLQTYYKEENRENIQAYLDINRDVVVVEDKSAGSNASTVVVQKKQGGGTVLQEICV